MRGPAGSLRRCHGILHDVDRHRDITANLARHPGTIRSQARIEEASSWLIRTCSTTFYNTCCPLFSLSLSLSLSRFGVDGSDGDHGLAQSRQIGRLSTPLERLFSGLILYLLARLKSRSSRAHLTILVQCSVDNLRVAAESRLPVRSELPSIN